MSDEVIEYHSETAAVYPTTDILETKSQNGITCIWSGKLVDGFNSIKYTWKFNWDELAGKRVDGLSGYIVTRRPVLTAAENVRFEVELTKYDSVVEKTIVNANRANGASAAFDYYLTPIYAPEVSYDEIFAASDKTDAILVVEEKKVHVNKAFLSFHSDFFTALFSSNFKEGQLAEIPIKDVSYEDFGLLMSTIYPNTVFPNDITAKKLLELADRFLMPSVTAHVEYHLLHNSKISNEKMMWMADAYGMQKLLEKCIRVMDTVEKAKALEQSEDYGKLSDGAKAKILDKLMKMI